MPEAAAMAEYSDREHFIPVRCVDLIDVLTMIGLHPDQAMTAGDQKQFRNFAALLMEHFHHENHQRLLKLKDAYAPFDPDADTRILRLLTPATAAEQERLFSRVFRPARKANYLSRQRKRIEKAMEGASYWGINMRSIGRYSTISRYTTGGQRLESAINGTTETLEETAIACRSEARRHRR
jgi:hypothetical protein